MPEGPEIRRAADRVAAAIEGRIADDVFFAFDQLKPFEMVLTGRRVEEVTTRGKGMLTRFEGGLARLHPQPALRPLVRDANGRLPETRPPAAVCDRAPATDGPCCTRRRRSRCSTPRPSAATRF